MLYNKNFIINYYYNFLCRMHDQVLHYKYKETHASSISSVVVAKDIMLTDCQNFQHTNFFKPQFTVRVHVA